MSQSTDITLSPGISGTAQRTELNDILAAILTGHSGASRPSYLTGKTGGWTKIVSGTVHELYYFDGTDDILVGTLNLSANTFVPSGQLGTFGNAVSAKTGGFTAVIGDYGKLFTCNATTAAFTAALDTTSTLGASWFAIFQKTDATANAVTIDPAGGDTINGGTTIALTAQYDTAIVIKASASTFVAVIVPGTAMRDPAANGIVARTALNTSVARVITGSTNIAVSNGDGISGNPTISLTGQVPVANGGTGRSTVTSGSILIGAGTSVMTEVAPGTTGNKLTSNGTAWISAASTDIAIIRRRIITSDSTYIPDPNLVVADVILQAAGGGGAIGGGSVNGGSGSNASFGGTLLNANGGSGGVIGGAPATGGTASNGDINITGSDATIVFSFSASASHGGSNLFDVVPPVVGANSLLGFGGVKTSGVGYGSGGGATFTQVGLTGYPGAAGGYCRRILTAAQIGASKAVVLGSAGSAGSGGHSGAPGVCIIDEHCSA